MKVSELDFNLPSKLLATRPQEIDGKKRSDSRMLVINRESGQVYDKRFIDFYQFFEEGDLVVLNDSKTINAVFRGRNNQGLFLEITLCRKIEGKLWLANIINIKTKVDFTKVYRVNNQLSFKILSKSKNLANFYNVELIYEGDLLDITDKYGKPIISNYAEKAWDIDYYRNEYADKPGSVELPAAGRHFTKEVIENLKERGIDFAYITLHTGLSSLQIETTQIEDHKMYEEYYSISKETANKINKTKEKGKKVIAIGTTVTRTLESCVNKQGKTIPGSGLTDLYIYPGFDFKVIDALLTNFHGPRSSRIVLASAFAGKQNILKGYDLAIQKEFKFYEFGDTTLII
mgnify:CR=1 FL=1